MMNCWKKYRPASVFFVITVLFAVAHVHDLAQAGTYTDSAHGKNVLRKSPQDNGYAKGNCYHCHEQHASVNNAEPFPGGGPDIYLGFASEENLCFGCHSTSSPGPVGTALDLIEIDMLKLYGHGTGTIDDIVSLANLHKANEQNVAEAANTPHVECTDCHNPHVAQPEVARRTIGLNTIVTPSPLEGVDGVDFSTYPSWSLPGTLNDPTLWNPPDYTAGTPITPFATATKEYQICFKCHSSSNLYTEDFDSNPGGSLEWTDVALEFNPDNYGIHPIVNTMTDATNTEALDSGQLIAPWLVNRGLQTMYCSDCHASRNNAAPYGPHGSAVKWMLTGTNKAWPYDTAAKNGTASITDTDYRTLNDTDCSGSCGQNDNIGTDDGLFCRNCHPNTNDNTINRAHSNHSNRVSACVLCHLRVPHGGKVSSMIAATGGASGTGWDNLPARYRPDGSTDAPWSARVYRFQKNAATSYIKDDCRADGSIRGQSCNAHGGLGACTTPGCVW